MRECVANKFLHIPFFIAACASALAQRCNEYFMGHNTDLVSSSFYEAHCDVVCNLWCMCVRVKVSNKSYKPKGGGRKGIKEERKNTSNQPPKARAAH